MKRPIHHFLFALYFILFLYSENQTSFPFWVIYKPSVLALAFAVLAYLFVRVVFRRTPQLSALIVSLFVCTLVAYGRIVTSFSSYMPQVSLLGNALPPQILLGTPIVGMYVVGVWLCTGPLRDYNRELTRITTLTGTILCGVVCTLIGVVAIITGEFEWYRKAAPASTPILQLTEKEARRLPHIFHIVLDEYGREDNLRELYGYNNSEFLDSLRNLGFFVASQARSNYSHTPLTMASLLNYTHLSDLTQSLNINPSSYSALRNLIVDSRLRNHLHLRTLTVNSRLRNLLHKHGYRFAALQSGFYVTDFAGYADIFLPRGYQNEFTQTFFDLTIAPPVVRLRERERKRITSAFNQLPILARSNEPLYVFAHIMAPHPPFVFNADGSDPEYPGFYGQLSANDLLYASGMSRQEYARQYVSQLRHVNRLVLGAIHCLIENAAVPPIIVVHGDHGPGTYLTHESIERTYLKDRFGILYAMRLPGAGARLEAKTTPVNILPTIFNHLWNVRLPHVPDRSYFATPSQPYRLWDVTDQIGSEADTSRLHALRELDLSQSAPQTLPAASGDRINMR